MRHYLLINNPFSFIIFNNRFHIKLIDYKRKDIKRNNFITCIFYIKTEITFVARRAA